MCLSHRSGIGGGGFMAVRLPPSAPDGTSEVWTIDFRETAPALANATMYKKNPINARFGGLSVGVPGEVRGLAEAHMRWGKLPWRRLVQPSADIASGWTVGKELGLRIHVSYATGGIIFNLILIVSDQNTALCFWNIPTGVMSLRRMVYFSRRAR